MAGSDKKKIIVDPGFGFGKNRGHNLQLLARLQRFTELGVPVLAGLSRKKTIGDLTGRDVPADRVHGSVAAHLIAAQNGARIVRVHDVAATVDALRAVSYTHLDVYKRQPLLRPAEGRCGACPARAGTAPRCGRCAGPARHLCARPAAESSRRETRGRPRPPSP